MKSKRDSNSSHEDGRITKQALRAARNQCRKKRGALAWLRTGAPIVPLIEGEKKPIMKGGVHAALSEPAEVLALFAKRPDANYGVKMGVGSGFLALDVDGPEGKASLRALARP